MTNSVGEMLSDSNNSIQGVNNNSPMRNPNNLPRKPIGVMGSRRIFAAAFKLKVLDSYRSDIECRGNQRATARKYGIHRRQIQKWLQCEKNLRSSCTENKDGNEVIVSKSIASASAVDSNGINIIGTATSKTGESTVVTTSSCRAPGALAASMSALNLSLARLHGDELTTLRGPPPHPPSHCSSSTSSQYTPHTPANPLPRHALLIGYTEYSDQNLHHHHHHHQRHQLRHHRSEDNGIPDYQIFHASSPIERKFYVLSHPAYEPSASGDCSGSDAQLHHHSEQASYLASTDHGYNSTVNKDHRILGSIIHQSSNPVAPAAASLSISSSPSRPHPSDVDSPGNKSLATVIKMERASPDSPATPVSYDEAPSSPGITTTTRSVYPVSQHTFVPACGIATQAIATVSVHCENPRRTDPGTHVHACVDAYTSMDFKKKEQHNELLYVKKEDDEKIIIKDELQEMYVPTEVIVRKQDEDHAVNKNRDGFNYNEDVALNYNTPAVSLSQSHSEIRPRNSIPVGESSILDRWSPKGAASISSRSTSSCSDGEIDPMNYSSSYQNPSGDLSRRRSFSLRFKLDVLNAFHGDAFVAKNQRATARKFGINRRQVQKWLGQETELRGEIALRGGDLRLRLGPLQGLPESAVDLRTSSTGRGDVEMKPSSPLYCCGSFSQRLEHYPLILVDSDVSQRTCSLSCCPDNLMPSFTACSSGSKRTWNSQSQQNYHCSSPRDSIGVLTPDSMGINPLPSKRTICNCCYHAPFPKRLCADMTDLERIKDACRDQPPQEVPLCLVKAKYSSMPSPLQTERVTSTVPTPPALAAPPSSSNKDTILFKPYLDNPVSKPTNKTHHDDQHHNLSTHNSHQNVIVRNNDWNTICNLNGDQGHDYAVELSLRVPVSWRAPSHVAEFPECIRSAFARPREQLRRIMNSE